jgi:BNR repeat protein
MSAARRYLIAGLVIGLTLIVSALVIRAVSSSDTDRAGQAAGNPRAGGVKPGTEEGEEETQVTAERLDALQAARASGRFGAKVARTARPARGWVGSRILNATRDDWEPAVAADPEAPYVYLLTTRYGTRACGTRCPTPFIVLTVSQDGGENWGPQVPLCRCVTEDAEYDPIIEVVPDTGAVYAAYLTSNPQYELSTVFQKSTDHGATWTRPVRVHLPVAWTDKPEIASSASGKDVYISWNGPSNGDLYVSQSHDFGATWTVKRLTNVRRYYYAYDARVLSDGTVVFSESSIVYAGDDVVAGSQVWHHAVISRDEGATWQNVVVAKVPVGENCVAEGCGPDFYIGQTSVVSDAPGHLVFAYEGPATGGGPQRVFVSTSSDEGLTWSTGRPLSVAGEDATQPRLASSGGGDVRIWYMQTAGGDDPDAWNVWYRRSRDGGRGWHRPVRISDAPADAAGYVNEHGFAEIYGDYGEIAVTSAGKTIATWGEGFSYTGPGGTWFNIQR